MESFLFTTLEGTHCRYERGTVKSVSELPSGPLEGVITGAPAESTKVKFFSLVFSHLEATDDQTPDWQTCNWHHYRCIKPEEWAEPCLIYDALLGGRRFYSNHRDYRARP